jgi:hypothetical protein
MLECSYSVPSVLRIILVRREESELAGLPKRVEEVWEEQKNSNADVM